MDFPTKDISAANLIKEINFDLLLARLLFIGIHAPFRLTCDFRTNRDGAVRKSLAVNTIRPKISRIIPVITEIIIMLFGGVLISVKRLTPSRDNFLISNSVLDDEKRVQPTHFPPWW